MLPFAVILALVLEGSRLMTFRWDFTLEELTRIADICSLLIVGMFVYLFVTEAVYDVFFIFLRWFPFALFPLIAAQAYSSSGVIDLRALLMTVRKRKTSPSKPPVLVDVSYVYVMCCIIAAAAANSRQTNQFYAGLFLLAAWTFWSVRSKRYSPVVWGLVLLIAAGTGYAGHIQLRRAQSALERSELLARLFRRLPQDPDPYQSMTAIGDVGTVKLSNEVVFRVKSETGYRGTLLLREASYTTYKRSRWFAARDKFEPLDAELDGTTWKIPPIFLDEKSPSASSAVELRIADIPVGPSASKDAGVPTHNSTALGADGGQEENRITVSSYLDDGKGMLKVPTGTFQIEDLQVLKLLANQFGALKVEEGPKIVTCQPLFTQNGAYDSPPDTRDLSVPPDVEPAITAIAETLHLEKLNSATGIMQTIAAFFRKEFSYSLELGQHADNSAPLSDFLRHTRRGHCEYFATATVLLLRAAGIPARYAVGYSIDGLEEAGEWEMVRGRHGHAWALVYLNGTWQNFDTTPPSWVQIENDAASWFESLSDMWATWMFAYTEWRQREGGEELSPYFMLLLIPLVLILGRKLYAKKRTKQKRDSEKATEEPEYPGLDSAFYQIEQDLQEAGLTRHPWETLSDWLQRSEQQSTFAGFYTLQPLLTLHYRYRFDPKGLTRSEKDTLHGEVRRWLEKHQQSS